MKLIAYKGIVQIDPASIVEPELKRLLNELKHVLNDDTLYDKVCIFIFLLCDLSNDNPLVDRPYNTRREEALEIAFKEERDRFMALKDNNEIIRDTINKCIEIYIKYVNTDEQKDIATYSKKMDQFRVMLNGMKPAIEKNTNIRTNMISYSTNMDIINSVLGDIVKLIQAKASMVALHTTGAIPKHLRGKLSGIVQEDLLSSVDVEIENQEADGDTTTFEEE
jgi:hypothetical protein